MDFADSAEEVAWRERVRGFLGAHWRRELGTHPDIMADQASLFDTPRAAEWAEICRENGWTLPSWPVEYGGMGLSISEQFILKQEFAEAGAPSPNEGGVAGAALILAGSDEQRHERLPKLASGEERWCQGFSEPGAGSDLASLTTRAIRDGDYYVVNGQKTWTSNAHESQMMLALVRTDPEAPKHRGISMMMIDLRSPGVSVQPLLNLVNVHHFNNVFFEDVKVPRANLIGGENEGWYLAARTLDVERSGIGSVVQMRRYFGEVTSHAVGRPGNGGQRATLAARAVELEVAALLGKRVVSLQMAGDAHATTMAASVAKLFATELKQRLMLTLTNCVGLWGDVVRGGGSEPSAGFFDLRVAEQYANSVGATIGAGTSEIQRNVIAGRGLALPRG